MLTCLWNRRAQGRRLGLGALALSGALCIAAPAQAGDLADVKARGKLVMLSFPVQKSDFISIDLDAMQAHGLAFKDLHDPKDFKGFDVELLKGFAASLGVALEIHPVTSGYDGLLAALEAKEGDLVASSLTITDHRRERFDFPEAYLKSWIAVAVPKGSPIARVGDLQGKKVALMHGSSQLELVKSLGLTVQIQLTDFALQNYAAVTEGEADFTLLDSTAEIGQPVSRDYPDLVVALRLKDFGYGVAMRKGSDLVAPFNAYLAKIGSSGELVRLALRFFPPVEAAPEPAKVKVREKAAVPPRRGERM